MRISRFYTPRKNLRAGSSIKLGDSDVIHIRKVLRLKKGERVILFNGETQFLAELKIVSSDTVMARILEENYNMDIQNVSEKKITLFQALLRAGKFDDIIEKTTELGVSEILPVECEFSQSKISDALKKIERYQKKAIAASKQCERIDIPEIHEPIGFKEAVKSSENFDLVLFFTIPREKIPESSKAISFKELINNLPGELNSIAYFIGPEGGFSPTEHKLALEKGVKFVKLNSNILRSETAAIAALTLIKNII